jgi:AcrR family transcriptional regulator
VATTELSAETRTRILDAAWRLAADGGASAVSVKDVAAAAGVSRQLVYFHYQNRAGLLVAMARHRDAASGFRRRVAAARMLPPVEGLAEFLREWCGYLPEIFPVARALEAAYITGDDGGEAWQDRMGELREACRLALDRVAAGGYLAAGWTTDAAADWAWAHIQPSAWAHLVGACKWEPADFTERTVAALLAQLIQPRQPVAAPARRYEPSRAI